MDERSLVNDARVLLAQLLRSQWGELHVRTPHGEIFIGRPGAGPNPMRGAASAAGHPPVSQGSTSALAARVAVRAPHVGTVRAVLPAGTSVEAGTVVVRLAVLGEETEIRSAHAGIVADVFAVDGEFVEYESPLFSLATTQ